MIYTSEMGLPMKKESKVKGTFSMKTSLDYSDKRLVTEIDKMCYILTRKIYSLWLEPAEFKC
jgi:hypothetical protein